MSKTRRLFVILSVDLDHLANITQSGKLHKKRHPSEAPFSSTTDPMAYEPELDEIRRELKSWRTSCIEAQKTVTKREEELAKVQDDLDHAIAVNERAKHSASQMQKAMENKDLFLGLQKTDNDIQTGFNSLINAIKTWSSNFMGGHGQEPVFLLEALPKYRNVVPQCREITDIENLLAKKKSRRLFVRGWTAYIMSDLIFKTLPQNTSYITEDIMSALSNSDLWLEEDDRDSLQKLETKLLYCTHEYNLSSLRLFTDSPCR